MYGGEIAYWIGRAVETFDHLASIPSIRDRVVIVDNIDDSKAYRERNVDLIEAFVISGGRGHTEHPSEPPLRSGS